MSRISPSKAGARQRPAPFPPGSIELVARRFGVLADPLRLRLVHLLFDGEKSVRQLVREAGGSQGNISRQLLALADAGLLRRRREGVNVWYAVADRSVYQLCEIVCGSLEDRLARQAKVFRRR